MDTGWKGIFRAPRPRALSSSIRGTKKRISSGDLVFVHEVFDDEALEWVPYSGTAVVVEVEALNTGKSGPARTLVSVLIEGRVVDDYYESELTAV